MITRDQLCFALPHAKPENIDKYWDYLTNSMAGYGIDTPERQAAFLAQLAHESAYFSAVLENLNYSEMGLLNTFSKYFSPTGGNGKKRAADYARKPEKIANWVYANRMGNGDEASGDGWKFRGRGLIQLTGRDMYERFENETGELVVDAPQLLVDPQYAAMTACWFWSDVRDLNPIADLNTENGFKQITIKINGGLNGWDDRLKKWNAIKQELGI